MPRLTRATGDNAFVFVGNQTFSGVAGQLHAVPKQGGLMVEGDVNGDGIADFQIELLGITLLQDYDFIL